MRVDKLLTFAVFSGMVYALLNFQDELEQIGDEFMTWAIPKVNYAKYLIFKPLFDAAEIKYNLPHGLLSRVAWQESRFNENAVSPAGAQGLMQFMPATAQGFDIDPFSPSESIDAAARYLKSLFSTFKSWPLAVGSYNWGQGNMAAWLKTGKGAKGQVMPNETIQYITSISKDMGWQNPLT